MINLNGTIIRAMKLPSYRIKNRGLLYGDAVFETIKAVNGQLFFWEDHYFRLMASMRILTNGHSHALFDGIFGGRNKKNDSCCRPSINKLLELNFM